MKSWNINGFAGINNVQTPSALKQPHRDQAGANVGLCEMVTCVNYDIDDNGGLIQRDDAPPIFSETYDAKLTQVLGAWTLTAQANLLLYSKAFQTDRDVRRMSIEYPALITLIQEVESGLWLSTTEGIYFHKGKNPQKLGGFTQIPDFNFPAIMGTGEKVHTSKLGLDGDKFVAMFATTRGICYGTDSGELVNVSEGIYSYEPGQRGISYVEEHNGMVQYQVKMINPDPNSYNPHERKVAITVDSY